MARRSLTFVFPLRFSNLFQIDFEFSCLNSSTSCFKLRISSSNFNVSTVFFQSCEFLFSEIFVIKSEYCSIELYRSTHIWTPELVGHTCPSSKACPRLGLYWCPSPKSWLYLCPNPCPRLKKLVCLSPCPKSCPSPCPNFCPRLSQ